MHTSVKVTIALIVMVAAAFTVRGVMNPAQIPEPTIETVTRYVHPSAGEVLMAELADLQAHPEADSSACAPIEYSYTDLDGHPVTLTEDSSLRVESGELCLTFSQMSVHPGSTFTVVVPITSDSGDVTRLLKPEHCIMLAVHMAQLEAKMGEVLASQRHVGGVNLTTAPAC